MNDIDTAIEALLKSNGLPYDVHYIHEQLAKLSQLKRYRVNGDCAPIDITEKQPNTEMPGNAQ